MLSSLDFSRITVVNQILTAAFVQDHQRARIARRGMKVEALMAPFALIRREAQESSPERIFDGQIIVKGVFAK
jgi:hypothetical protein